MNELIDTLAKQSGRGSERWNNIEQFDTFLEKFARSIVRECVNQCFTEDGERIRKHFRVDGVE